MFLINAPSCICYSRFPSLLSALAVCHTKRPTRPYRRGKRPYAKAKKNLTYFELKKPRMSNLVKRPYFDGPILIEFLYPVPLGRRLRLRYPRGVPRRKFPELLGTTGSWSNWSMPASSAAYVEAVAAG